METIELNEDFIAIAIPTATVELTIYAKVYEDGELMDVQKTYGLDELRKMFKEADEGYIPSDAVFTLTDKGREYAERLMHQQCAKFKEGKK